MENDVKPTPTVIKLIEAFTERTSCHGVKNILDRKTIPNNWRHWKNITWLLLTMCGFGMACQGLFFIIDDYFTYPTSTRFKTEYQKTLQFPAVTLCNLNLAVPDRLLSFKGFEHLRKYLDRQAARNLKPVAHEYATATRQVASAIRTLSIDEKEYVAHTMADMLLECTFDGNPCNASEFISTYDYRFGICQSFNTGFIVRGKGTTALKELRKTGKGTALNLFLDIQSDLYMPISDEVGMHVLIHEPGKFSSLADWGFPIAPGYVTSLGLSIQETVNVGAPWGACVVANSEEDKERNMYYLSFNTSYTKQMCMNSCTQAHVMRDCGCCDPNMPCGTSYKREMFGIVLPNNGALLQCKTTSQLHCIQATAVNVQNSGTCSQKCPPQCKEISYKVKQSEAIWPNKMLAANLYKAMDGFSRLGNASTAEKVAFVRENVLKLDIHFSSRSKSMTITQPTYTWGKMLSNIGGQLGLWLGFSLLTAFEFVELLVDILVIQSFKTIFLPINGRT